MQPPTRAVKIRVKRQRTTGEFDRATAWFGNEIGDLMCRPPGWTEKFKLRDYRNVFWRVPDFPRGHRFWPFFQISQMRQPASIIQVKTPGVFPIHESIDQMVLAFPDDSSHLEIDSMFEIQVFLFFTP